MEFALEPLSPKEIQARVRAGASAEIVAAETGWSLDKVQRYAGPPLAEREYIAGRAQLVEIRRTGTSVSLGAAVLAALSAENATDIRWDAARRSDAKWVVMVTFISRGAAAHASWTYDNLGRTVQPLDETARRLMGVSDEQIFDYITDEPIAIVNLTTGIDELIAVEPTVAALVDRPRLVAVPDSPAQLAADLKEPPLDVLIPIDEPAAKAPAKPVAKPTPKVKVKGRRASVPSWDEILFGATRGDDV